MTKRDRDPDFYGDMYESREDEANRNLRENEPAPRSTGRSRPPARKKRRERREG